ncbi:MAG: bifunctional protein-serine/threonine kinase/phosphatase [Rhodomicrobium sp.]
MLSRAASEIAISVGQHSIAGRKSRNDDSYGVLLPEKALLATKGVAIAIADGMSSSEAAKEASETCVRSFLDDYFATPPSWTVKTSVERVLSAANRWMQSQSEALSAEGRGMVSTFSGAVLKSSIAHIFHVGDSRIYLLRDRHIERLTNDHRVRVSRQQEYLSRAFGMERDLAVDYRKLPVERGDILVFTTDGVHDFLSGAQIANIILSTPSDLNGAAERIVSAAFAQNSPDNLTCQIVRIDDPGAADQQAQSERLSALPFPRELFAGSDFEGYAIIRELHLSKRTQVYLGEDKATGEIVAIKTPSVNCEDDARYIEMFTREEWIGRLVSSPHVLKVLHTDRARRSLYYVTEYFEGQTLRQWMLDHPSRDLETVRRLVEQIAKGLRAFHRKEILHRDLKPENILIDRNGACKIIDFGSAWVGGIEEAAAADGESFAGTVGYAAPEYFRGEPPTTRSDIYSLGVIAYELLTGHLPYGRGFASAKDVDRLDYRPARRFRKDLPVWVDAAIEEAVRKNPQRRTGVLSAFVEDLRKPNPSLMTSGFVPLMERDPVSVWRVFVILLAVLNILLLYLLSR